MTGNPTNCWKVCEASIQIGFHSLFHSSYGAETQKAFCKQLKILFEEKNFLLGLTRFWMNPSLSQVQALICRHFVDTFSQCAGCRCSITIENCFCQVNTKSSKSKQRQCTVNYFIPSCI